MNRILASLSIVALAAATASAQCLNVSSPGTLIPITTGDSDDGSSSNTALGFSFPVAGAAFASYTNFRVGTNGWIFLTDGVSTLGLPSNGSYGSTGTGATGMRGSVGHHPLLCPWWGDLVIGVGGGIYVDSTSNPGVSCRISFINMFDWNSPATLKSFQVELFATGEVRFTYLAGMNNTATASTLTRLVGVSARNGLALPTASNLVPGPASTAGGMMFESFNVGAFDGGGSTLSFVPSGAGWNESVTCQFLAASNTSYGAGCYSTPAVVNSSLTQEFAGSPAAKTALDGNSMTFTATPSGYIATWNVGGASAYVAPGIGATTLTFLPDGDDGDAVITPSLATPVPGGTATDWTVSVNGILTAGTVANNAGDFSPTRAEVATSTGLAFYTWRDWNADEVGSGPIQTEEVGNMLYVTWNGVEAYGTPSPNVGTFQYQVNMATGDVTAVWVSFEASTSAAPVIVGATLAGTSPTPPSTTLATALPFTMGADVPALVAMSLSAAPGPVSTPSSGTTVTYTINNIPLACPSPAPVFNFGILMLSVGQDLVGTDLGFLGAPGCNLHITSIDQPLSFVGSTPSQTVTFPVPAGVAYGFQFYAQAAALVCPNSLPNGQNAYGVTVSNGVRSFVSSL